MSDPPVPPPLAPATTSSSSPSAAVPPSSRAKLRKIPPIPIRGSPNHEFTTKSDEDLDEGQQEDEDEEEDEEEGDDDNENPDVSDPVDADAPVLLASLLGLNRIRTRSAPSPLRFSSSIGAPLNLGDDSISTTAANPPATKLSNLHHRASSLLEQGVDRFDNKFQLFVKTRINFVPEKENES